MDAFKPKMNVHKGPESKIQAAIIRMLRGYEWFVKETHGNAFQSGFPDLYATHPKFHQRWIEVKVPTQFSFTPAQVRDYPLFVANGSPIWILTAATDEEYRKLFKPCNLSHFMSAYCNGVRDISKWGVPRREV